MRRLALRVLTAIQLTRLTMAFGAVSDLWFVILLSRAGGGAGVDANTPVLTMSLGSALVAGAVVAVGLFGFGAALNDLLDARHDTAFSPDRPIPAGRIRTGQVAVVTIGSLLVAMVGATALGQTSLLITALTAGGILFYNATAKHIPAVGLVTIGLVHALHMLIPNEHLAFMLPVWLVMTHAVLIAAAVYRLEDKRPRLSGRSLASAGIGYLFWSALILSLGAWRAGESGLWPIATSPWRVLVPMATAALFVVVARRKTTGVTNRVAAEKLRRYGAMWQSLYGAAWLFAAGLSAPAVWIGLFALAGFVGMTIIKEINGLTGRPIAYRG
ncbi:MAG: hypothetical protein KDA22_09130 [Phycisphaerales bacterium]|nr:hypothetical protein [Phycisphaerales bacterium]